MSPKKNKTNGDAGESSKFSWEGANDNKLLLLTQGRYVKPDEYEKLSSAFNANNSPASGITTGSIRNRISALRVKQRDLYDGLNWELPDGGAGHSAKKPRGGKRAADDDGGEPETPTKKPRAKKAKKSKEAMLDSDREAQSSDSEENAVHVVVKEEEQQFEFED
ncbi:hypothetical protein BKA66DRAFT_601479 [Pyrenochaeta sp. MPI-SDFR-AT-0127]|nr:hypothetical protein BKA66DRAFT_601479 [Pyrenochaeta sp. MPI-SDFR-AT-0127]